MSDYQATRTKELVAALEMLERALNSMGSDAAKQEAVADYFSRMHRTLQSQFVATIIMPVLVKLDAMQASGWVDMRNQAAAEMAHKMLEAIPDQRDRYLPLI